MDLVIIIICGLLLVTGIAGSLLPILPGLPLSYLGLLVLHFATDYSFSVNFLVVWALVVVSIQLLDYYVPIWGTKRFGGSKKGVLGSMIGLLVGLFMGPWGVILGPFFGAFIGERLSHKDVHKSLQAAIGSFIGILVGTVIKLVAGGLMFYYFIARIVQS
jgi:uncharacterized protein YqgC (DUF456 family)